MKAQEKNVVDGINKKRSQRTLYTLPALPRDRVLPQERDASYCRIL